MNRKVFIQKTMGAMLIALPAFSLIGCSSSDNGSDNNPDPEPDPDPQGNCLENGTEINISANHGHSLNVSQADVQAGVEKVYSIQGSSGHNHEVTLTVANFDALKSNNAITVGSSTEDGHTHSVRVSCA